jgi:hypothetical protein
MYPSSGNILIIAGLFSGLSIALVYLSGLSSLWQNQVASYSPSSFNVLIDPELFLLIGFLASCSAIIVGGILNSKNKYRA